MTTVLHHTCTAVLLLALAASPAAVAQPAMSDKTFKSLGGEYSQQCSDPTSLRAFVRRDGLALDYRGKAVASGRVREDKAYLGKSPPKDFSLALVGAVPRRGKLAFVVHAPPSGPELEIDADPPVLEAVGLLRLSKLRFRPCR